MAKKRAVYFLIYLIFSGGVCAQPSRPDSLYLQLEQAETDSLRWDALFVLSQYYRQNNADSALETAFRSLEFARKAIPNRIPRSLINIGLVYYERGQYEEASIKYFEAIDATKETPCPSCMATALGNIGLVFLQKKAYDKAEEYLKQGLTQNRAIPDTNGIIRNLNNLGLLYTETLQLAEAEQVLLEAVELSEQADSDHAVDLILNNLGNIRYYQQDFSGALNYYQ